MERSLQRPLPEICLMTNDNQENFIEKDTFVIEENTEINLPPAPSFDSADAAPVQPLISVAAVPGETLGNYPPQPQIVYVAQPTAVPPLRGWGWIPAALVVLLIATVAGAYVGAALYKRSTSAESAPYTSEDVSPYADSSANEHKSLKTNERNELTVKGETASSENVKSADVKNHETKEVTSVSSGFAAVQTIDSSTANNDLTGDAQNDGEENERETEETAVNDSAKSGVENKAVNIERQPVFDDDAPPPVRQKSKEQPRKVENKKDTENIVSPQRELPD